MSEKYPSSLTYSNDAGCRGSAVKFTDKKFNLTLLSEKIKDTWML